MSETFGAPGYNFGERARLMVRLDTLLGERARLLVRLDTLLGADETFGVPG